jgi:hypothetical protein
MINGPLRVSRSVPWAFIADTRKRVMAGLLLCHGMETKIRTRARGSLTSGLPNQAPTSVSSPRPVLFRILDRLVPHSDLSKRLRISSLDAILTSRLNEVVVEPLHASLQTRVDPPGSSAVRHCVHLTAFISTEC